VGQPSMPEIPEAAQPLYRHAATLSSRMVIREAVGGTGHLRAAVDVTIPHAAVPIVVSIVAILVTGVVSIVGKCLFFYARNRRARSIAEIRRAAIEGKIAVSDAEKLIRADVEEDADPKEVAEGDEIGEERGTRNDSEDAEGALLGSGNTPALSAAERVALMLHRVHLF
jgi:hypothetical protein